MKKFLFLPFLTLVVILLLSFNGEARKVGYRFPAKETKEEKGDLLSAGTFKVDKSSEADDTYSMNDIVFSGFDKKLNSSSESFFITNKTDRIMTCVEISIEYLTPDGRQLDKKVHEVRCNIPPGETRKTDIKSWDTQHSFFYVKSAPARGGGSPFIVRFSPLAYYLRY